MAVSKTLRLSRRRRDQSLEIGRRQRLRNVESLAESAPQRPQPLPLRLGLDTLGHNTQAENAAKSDDRFGER